MLLLEDVEKNLVDLELSSRPKYGIAALATLVLYLDREQEDGRRWGAPLVLGSPTRHPKADKESGQPSLLQVGDGSSTDLLDSCPNLDVVIGSLVRDKFSSSTASPRSSAAMVSEGASERSNPSSTVSGSPSGSDPQESQ